MNLINTRIYMFSLIIIVLAVLYVLSCFILGIGGKDKITLYIGWGLRVIMALICIGVILAIRL